MSRILNFGELVLCRYTRWKHDSVPLIFVLHSDARYTHALNSHYLSPQESDQLRRLMSYVPAGQSQYVYEFLKARFVSVLRAYRKYFTPLIFEIKTWKPEALKDQKDELGDYFKAGTNYQRVLSRQKATPATKPIGITGAETALLTKLRQTLTRLTAKERQLNK